MCMLKFEIKLCSEVLLMFLFILNLLIKIIVFLIFFVNYVNFGFSNLFRLMM